MRFFKVVPVGCVADVFILFELVADHLQELVGVGAQVLHEIHQVLNGLFHHHGALRAEQNKRGGERNK